MCKLQTCTNQREGEEVVEVALTLEDYDDDDWGVKINQYELGGSN